LLKVCIGLEWSANEGRGEAYDLDLSVFMLDDKGLIPDESCFVFYGNGHSNDSSMFHFGDNKVGNSDLLEMAEMIQIDLLKVDLKIVEIIVVVTIHDAFMRKQNFGQIRNSYIRLINDLTKQEIVNSELDEEFSNHTAIEFIRLYKRNNFWNYEVLNSGSSHELPFIVSKYYKGSVIS